MLALLLLAAGCGSGSGSSSSGPTGASTSPSTSTSATPSSTPTTSSIPAGNGAATAFLPAYFTVNADDSVRPATIAGPVATTILLSITSRAPHAVQVTVGFHSLSVGPGGHGSARIAPLKAGRYPVDVNGTRQATLIIGAQPGP